MDEFLFFAGKVGVPLRGVGKRGNRTRSCSAGVRVGNVDSKSKPSEVGRP
jgi:hypothetical protein